MKQKKFDDNSLIDLLITIKDSYAVKIKRASYEKEYDTQGHSYEKVVTIKFIPVDIKEEKL
jgi:hypothetical protein